MELCGEFKHSVDAKNRLFVPAKHREILGESIMIVRDTDNKCLLVYSEEKFEEYKEKVLNKVPSSKRRDVNRFFFRNSLSASYDSQGRVLLTQELCDYAELARGTAVIVGCGDYAEIWNEENYNKKIDDEDAASISELIGMYDI